MVSSFADSLGSATWNRASLSAGWWPGRKRAWGARTRNTYLSTLIAFANWCVEDNRLATNPLARIAKANEDADRRRNRQALDEAELMQLLDATRRRPLLDART